MHFPHPHNSDFFTVLRDGYWKLIHNYGSQGYELFNLANDISESNDRASAEPERVMAMARKMSQQLDAMGAQYPRLVSDNSDRSPLMPADLTIDLDGDGLPDNNEDPNRNGLVDPGETDPDSDDTDGDNIDDGSEQRIGLDPLDASSFFYLRSIQHPDGTLEGFWPSAPGATFRVESGSDLAGWPTTLATGLPAAPGDETSFDFGQVGDRRFYRVALEQ